MGLRATACALPQGDGRERAPDAPCVALGGIWTDWRDMERNDEPPREWTAEEDEALRGLWPTHGKSWPEWETRLPGRTPNALESRARRLGLRRAAVPWTRRQLLCLSGCLRKAAAACGHEPAECVRMLQVMARMWEVSRGTRRGPLRLAVRARAGRAAGRQARRDERGRAGPPPRRVRQDRQEMGGRGVRPRGAAPRHGGR